MSATNWSANRLNTKGQCPVCLVKPLVYKREPHYFCSRCDRAFDLHSGVQLDNWAWVNGRRRRPDR